jgi:TRAP-type C4-dicarboxylate transport system permease small subunit
MLKWLDSHFEEMVLAFLLFCMMMLSGIQVCMRYVANSSLAWSEELTRYSFVWSGFLCIGYSIRRRTELRLDTAVAALPAMVRVVIETLLDIGAFALFSLFLYTGIVILHKTAEINQVSSALQIPMQYIYMAPVAGFLAGIIRTIQRIVCRISEAGKRNSFKKISVPDTERKGV